MKITYISTFLPRKCGIATFTDNLIKSIGLHLNENDPYEHANILALNEEKTFHQYGDDVKFIIRDTHQRDYVNAADYINTSDSDICVIEHEYGIFGGHDGVYILALTSRLQVPLVVTLHTVLREPSFTQKSIIKEFGRKAAKLVVMSQLAVEFLTTIYEVPYEKIEVIGHGVPDKKGGAAKRKEMQKSLKLTNRKVLMTFGLLGRNKGLETVINALPAVVEKHPDTIYLILGNTHPSVARISGEEYRNFLKRLIKQHGLEENVRFIKKFLPEDELFDYLSAADIYITPYLNEAQITSGTLSYAVGAGAAVVSTPYWHAQELLGNGRGRLFPFRDSDTLSKTLNDLLDNNNELERIHEATYQYGKNFRWPRVGLQYLDLLKKVSKNYVPDKPQGKTVIDPTLLPPFDLKHIDLLTDDTGIIQHAVHGIPNLKEGYCTDDNARGVLMCAMAIKQYGDEDARRLMPRYLAFLHYMQNEDGTFRNFLSFSRLYLDEHGTEDAFGRTIWALGYTIFSSDSENIRQVATGLFHRSVQQFRKLKSLRGVANSLIGVCYYLRLHNGDEAIISELKYLTQRMLDAFKGHNVKGWEWFEPVMTYDNGILPLALLHAAELLPEPEVLEAAMLSVKHLETVSFRRGVYTPVGNSGWYSKGEECPEFAQQAIDTMAAVLGFHQAYLLTKDYTYVEKLFKIFLWFLGENSMHVPLYDHETRGCHDGLEDYGINQNQGAESTLAYWISHLTVLNILEREYEYQSAALLHTISEEIAGTTMSE